MKTIRTDSGHVVPQVNINGTSAKELVEQYGKFGSKIRDAMNVGWSCAPHGRDYQLCPVGAYEAARLEHLGRMQKLQELVDELDEICAAIIAQIPGKK